MQYGGFTVKAAIYVCFSGKQVYITILCTWTVLSSSTDRTALILHRTMLRIAFLNVTETLPCEIGTALYKKILVYSTHTECECVRVLMEDKLYWDGLKIRLQLQRDIKTCYKSRGEETVGSTSLNKKERKQTKAPWIRRDTGRTHIIF